MSTAADAKLNMSLEDLIAQQRSTKPKAKAGQKVGKGKGKVAIKGQQGKQPAGKKGTPVRAPLRVQKGGVAKAAGPGKAAQRRPDVRVVPRGNAPAPRALPFRGPPMGYMGPMMGMPPMMPSMMMQQQMRGGAPPPGRWQGERFQVQQQQQQKPAAISTAKLFISNLDFNVTDDDIKELFGTIGTLKESGIHYDKSGRSMGTAHVVFARVPDAKSAFDKYNNVALDGKRMNIEMVDAPLPPGTIKKLSSGINVQKPGTGGGSGGGGGVRGRGHAHAAGDFMDTN